MKKKIVIACLPLLAIGAAVHAREAGHQEGMTTLAVQNMELEKNTDGKGFGPQSPRDIENKKGKNNRIFSMAPAYQKMNLCNIHFHLNAEHKGGEFTTFAGDDSEGHDHGHGTQAGYKYSGKLKASESKLLDEQVCTSEHGGLQVGDTVELHYVHSTAQVIPGPTLGACLSETNSNPQLRVEAQVMVLVNDSKAIDFNDLAKVGEVNGYQQALNIPKNAGRPIQYAGSTTGPSYNVKGSPLQVSWSVRPKVVKVNAASVGEWCKGNMFQEDHAHGARNLVVNEKLLSSIK